MKKLVLIKVVALFMSVMLVGACAPAVQMSVSLAGSLATKALKESTTPTVMENSSIKNVYENYIRQKDGINLRIGELQEVIIFKDNSVHMYNASVNDAPSSFIMVGNKEGKPLYGIYYKPHETNELSAFKKMNGVDKKSYLRKKLMETDNFDLGPVENDIATTASVSP